MSSNREKVSYKLLEEIITKGKENVERLHGHAKYEK